MPISIQLGVVPSAELFQLVEDGWELSVEGQDADGNDLLAVLIRS